MKASIVSIFTLFALFLGVLSAPSGVKRQAADVATIFNDLFDQVQEQTASINSTSDALSAGSIDDDTATTNVGTALGAITDAVNSATTQISALSASKRDLADGPSNADLAAIVFKLLLEISGTLNKIIATLGLQKLLSFLSPLVNSLSGLLASLDKVLDQVISLVKQLVDGLLLGLSVGLAGLIL